MVAASHMWLLRTWDVASVTDEMNFQFNLNVHDLYSHMWLGTDILTCFRLAPCKRNIMQATYVIQNFLVATFEQKEKETTEINI